DARLHDGSRVCIVIPPVAVDGPCLSIRRFHVRDLPLGAFGDDGVVSVLREVVRERCNVVVAGAASSGKTTLLNALCGHVGEGERIITVEDVAELRLQTQHVVRFEARPSTYDGALEVSMAALLRSALRMRPDRFVLGEVRGPEALDMLAAMNTGHHGSLATCHANSPDDVLRRVSSSLSARQTASDALARFLKSRCGQTCSAHDAFGPRGRQLPVWPAVVHDRDCSLHRPRFRRHMVAHHAGGRAVADAKHGAAKTARAPCNRSRGWYCS
ncbi:MAG: CpaF family protein, partial [Actinobacteria bacterium]|nr:CpaF family protein [Actinomycetota bacterium]